MTGMASNDVRTYRTSTDIVLLTRSRSSLPLLTKKKTQFSPSRGARVCLHLGNGNY